MNKRLLSVRQVADELGVAPTTVYAMCHRKQILHTRVGSGRGTIRIPEEALAAYLASVTVAPAAEIQDRTTNLPGRDFRQRKR